MATSGVITLDFEINDIVEEAFERAGVDVQALNAGHMRSARRSLNFVFAEWENLNLRIWAIDRQTATLAVGDTDFDLPAGTVDVIDAVLRRASTDTPLGRMGRAEYLELPVKTTQGMPSRFYIDRTTATAKMFVWNTSDRGTDTVVYDRIRRLYDVTAAQETADVPRRWIPALTAALAWEIYSKLPGEMRDATRRDDLIGKAASTYLHASREDRERGPVQILPDMSGYMVS